MELGSTYLLEPQLEGNQVKKFPSPFFCFFFKILSNTSPEQIMASRKEGEEWSVALNRYFQRTVGGGRSLKISFVGMGHSPPYTRLKICVIFRGGWEVTRSYK